MTFFHDAVAASWIAILMCVNRAREYGGFEVYAVRIPAHSVNARRKISRDGKCLLVLTRSDEVLFCMIVPFLEIGRSPHS